MGAIFSKRRRRNGGESCDIKDNQKSKHEETPHPGDVKALDKVADDKNFPDLLQRIDIVDVFRSHEDDLKKVLLLPGSEDVIPKYFAALSGGGVRIHENRVVTRRGSEIALQSSCLFFSDLSLPPESSLYFRILETYTPSEFYVGITNCKPSTLETLDLPIDSTELVNRHEYWVVEKIEQHLKSDDFLTIIYQADGKMVYKVNNNLSTDLFFFDTSQPVWLFFDMGNLQKLLLVGGSVCEQQGMTRGKHQRQIPVVDANLLDSLDENINEIDLDASPPIKVFNQRAAMLQPYENEHLSLINEKKEFVVLAKQENPIDEFESSSESKYQDSVDSSVEKNSPQKTCLVRTSIGASGVAKSWASDQPTTSSSQQAHYNLRLDYVDSDDDDSCHSDPALDRFLDDVQQADSDASYLKSIPLDPTAPAEDFFNTGIKQNTALDNADVMRGRAGDDEQLCAVCCGSKANSVVYDCGHICMCINCGKALLERERFPNCPICRKPIKDIIETYRS